MKKSVFFLIFSNIQSIKRLDGSKNHQTSCLQFSGNQFFMSLSLWNLFNFRKPKLHIKFIKSIRHNCTVSEGKQFMFYQKWKIRNHNKIHHNKRKKRKAGWLNKTGKKTNPIVIKKMKMKMLVSVISPPPPPLFPSFSLPSPPLSPLYLREVRRKVMTRQKSRRNVKLIRHEVKLTNIVFFSSHTYTLGWWQERDMKRNCVW